MRRLVVVSFIALAALVLAPGALSSPPTITRTPIDLTVVDDVDCGFPVEIHIVGTQLTILSTVQGDLREFDAFPNSRATLTNLDTGTTITASIAGPGHITLGADGSFTFVGTGPTLFFFGENPGITSFDGRYFVSFDAQGNLTFSMVGATRDLCAELAA
jgi:hypothetical protein